MARGVLNRNFDNVYNSTTVIIILLVPYIIIPIYTGHIILLILYYVRITVDFFSLSILHNIV